MFDKSEKETLQISERGVNECDAGKQKPFLKIREQIRKTALWLVGLEDTPAREDIWQELQRLAKVGEDKFEKEFSQKLSLPDYTRNMFRNKFDDRPNSKKIFYKPLNELIKHAADALAFGDNYLVALIALAVINKFSVSDKIPEFDQQLQQLAADTIKELKRDKVAEISDGRILFAILPKLGFTLETSKLFSQNINILVMAAIQKLIPVIKQVLLNKLSIPAK